jgi:hypothetical protein
MPLKAFETLLVLTIEVETRESIQVVIRQLVAKHELSIKVSFAADQWSDFRWQLLEILFDLRRAKTNRKLKKDDAVNERKVRNALEETGPRWQTSARITIKKGPLFDTLRGTFNESTFNRKFMSFKRRKQANDGELTATSHTGSDV